MITNESFTDASIIEVKDSFHRFFDHSNILVTQGFIGQNMKGEDTVLGFDGSDYSAGKFSNSLIEISDVSFTLWKKVQGVFTKDPNENKDASFIKEISRDDYGKNVVENNGSYVIRPDTIKGLNPKIDVFVRSFEEEFLSVNDTGTRIYYL